MTAVAIFLSEMQGNSARKIARKSRRVGRVAEAILHKVWRLHLRRSGFRDLESASNPDGPLSNVGQPSHLHDRLTFGERAGSIAARVEADSTAEFYRLAEHLAVRFELARDRQIATALSNGWGQRRIKAELRCGQDRIERVGRQLREWMKEGEADGEE